MLQDQLNKVLIVGRVKRYIHQKYNITLSDIFYKQKDYIDRDIREVQPN